MSPHSHATHPDLLRLPLTELPELNLPLTATLTVDFSDPDTKPDDTGGFRYYYEGESYLATYHAWENYACPESPQFFAA